jgi:hypothetical protein
MKVDLQNSTIARFLRRHVKKFLLLALFILPLLPFLVQHEAESSGRITALTYSFLYELGTASDLSYGLLLLLAFSSLTAYSIILAG